ncbi:hypothetical protein [Myroides odoratus]|uniref:hypothetical protein n=1 Tax=Myroides odoratus TaxID=256 RepID=UPI000765D5E0|nr:hypothetical protein [Myroides odoratus]
MKNKIKYGVALFLFLGLTTSYAQVRIVREGQNLEEEEKISKKTDQSLKTFDYKVSQIAVNIQNATVKEKEHLRIRVDSINNLIDTKAMTEEVGQEFKSKFAKEASDRIEKEVVRMQDSLTNVVQSQVNYAMKNGEFLKVSDTTKRMATIMIGKPQKEYRDRLGEKYWGEKRTSFRMSLVYGISNLATEGAFANSDIRYMPSNLFQGGFYLKTRLVKDKSLLYLRYGIVGSFNNLKSTGHRYFTVQDGETILVNHEKNLRKSRLSVASLQVPVYLEFDFTKPKIDEKTGKKYFRSEQTWRGGIGGYVSFANKNSKGHQVYRYREEGKQYRVDEKGDLGINKVRYGVGAYVGYRTWSLQFQYDVTPLFKNNSTNQNMWSLGIRSDI